MTTTTSTTSTTTYAYARVYNPSLRIENYTVSSKTFDIDEFVAGWVENPTFNSTFATAATYKNTAANILPIYQSNVAYSATAGTRYGLYRTPDSSGLAYWTNYCLVNGYNINTTAFRDAFFTAADSITTGVLANRHITQANVFLTLQNEYAETTVPKETDLYLEILSGPVYLPVTGEVQLPDGRSRQFAASLNQFGYARIPVPVKVDPSVTNGSSIFYTVNFPTPFVSNTTYRFLEAKISSPINNKKFIARLRQGGPSGNILANSQIVTITGAGISAFSGADMANIITANSIVFGNADNVGTKSANILTTTPGRYQAGSKQFIVRVRRGSFSGPIVANSQIINVMNLGYGTFTANDILGFTRIKALTSDTGMGAVYQRMSNVGYTPTPTTTSTSTSTSTTSTSTSTSTTSTSTSTSTTSTSTSTTTSSSTTTTTVPPPSTTTSTSTTSTSTTTTSTSTTTTSTSTTTSTTNAGNWTITHGQATNGYIIGDTIVVTVESDFANALFYVTVAGAGTVTPVSQGPLYTNSTPTTPGGTRYSGSTSFLTTGLGSIVVELRLSTISAPVRASIGLNIIVITSTSTSTSTTSTTTLVPLPTSTTTTSTSTTSTTTSAAPFSPTTTSSTTTTTTTTLAPTYILLSAPVIAGTAAVGTDITMTSDAAWDPAGASTGSMWQRSPALPPSDVWTNTGDVDNTYTITSSDIGYYFRLRKRSPDGVLTAYSNTIGPGGYYTTTTSTTSTSTSTSTTSTTTAGPSTTTTSTTSTTTTLAPAQTLLFLDSANTSSYNPATPGTWVDLSGNNRSANISPTSNNISYTSTAGTGLGLNFSRTQGTDFFTGNNSSALGAITGDITVEAWFSLRNPPITTHDLIALGSPGAYTFALQYTGTQLSFTRGTTSVSINHNITLSSYASPNWYQVVGVSTNGLLKLYFNGVEMDTTGTPGATYPATAGSEYNISNSTGLHDGKISIVRVFDRALTSPEVYATYNSYKTRHGLS